VFEIDSQTESEDENAIYATSYPSFDRRPNNIAKQEYEGKVSFPIASSPSADLDLTGIEVEAPNSSHLSFDRTESHDLEAPSKTEASSSVLSDSLQSSHRSNLSVSTPSQHSESSIEMNSTNPTTVILGRTAAEQPRESSSSPEGPNENKEILSVSNLFPPKTPSNSTNPDLPKSDVG